MKEREYSFMKCKPGEEPVEELVKESNLSKSQKDLLMGELIKTCNSMPKECVQKFTQYLLTSQNLQ